MAGNLNLVSGFTLFVEALLRLVMLVLGLSQGLLSRI
jgi:hypothetical protein